LASVRLVRPGATSREGRKHYPEAEKLFTTSLEITDKLGGKVLETYALSGRYDFVSIAEYPTPEKV